MTAGDDGIGLQWWPLDRIPELQAFIDREIRPGHVLATDETLLRWQHPPHDGRLSLLGATTADDTLVGILGVIPVGLCVRGERVDGGWLTTWNIAPEFRRQPVGLKLLQAVMARYPFVGTVGGNDTTMAILGALRFHLDRSMPRWILPVDSGALARLGLPGPARAAAAPPPAEIVSGLSDELERAWDDAWRASFAPHTVGTWRDGAYLRWRYADHPHFAYELSFLVDGDRPRALLVHRTEPFAHGSSEESVIRITEAIGSPGDVETLGRRLAEDAAGDGVAFIDFFCTSSRNAGGLERAGFVRAERLEAAYPTRFRPYEPEPRPLTIALRLRDAPPGTFEGEDVYFTRSDADQDRPN